MEKINSPQVIAEVAKRMGCYKKDAAELLQHFVDVIIENVCAGKTVGYKDLGIFYPYLSVRRGRQDQIRLKFRPAKKVKKKIASDFNTSENDY